MGFIEFFLALLYNYVYIGVTGWRQRYPMNGPAARSAGKKETPPGGAI